MQSELDLFKTLAAVMNAAGPGGIVAYLLWRDLVRPWRNGRNGKHRENPTGALLVGLAREQDLNNLAGSLREFRNEARDRLQDLGDRVSRIEGRLEAHGTDSNR